MTGEWRELHNEDVYILYSIVDTGKEEMGRTCRALERGDVHITFCWKTCKEETACKKCRCNLEQGCTNF
jgi:hypothetical protein